VNILAKFFQDLHFFGKNCQELAFFKGKLAKYELNFEKN